MVVLKVVENHGHNGDDEWDCTYNSWDEAYQYVLHFYFDDDEEKMQNGNVDLGEWRYEDTKIYII